MEPSRLDSNPILASAEFPTERFSTSLMPSSSATKTTLLIFKSSHDGLDVGFEAHEPAFVFPAERVLEHFSREIIKACPVESGQTVAPRGYMVRVPAEKLVQ